MSGVDRTITSAHPYDPAPRRGRSGVAGHYEIPDLNVRGVEATEDHAPW
jgi:hypothetical protein